MNDDMSDEEYEQICARIKEKVEKIKLRAQQGDAAAQNKLGIMYSHGLGVEIDDNEAGKWFHLAARQEYFTTTTDESVRRELKAMKKELFEDSVREVTKSGGCLSILIFIAIPWIILLVR